MFIEKLGIKKNFKDDGFIILDTTLNLNPNFKNIVTKIYKDINLLFSMKDYKKYGGYTMGNFGINQGPLGKKLFSLIFQKKLVSLLEKLTNKKIDNFCVNYGGNLTLPNKGLQHFHMDGDFKKEMYLVSIATEDINLMNGPTEICVGSHNKDMTYWKFLLSKKNKKKLTINKAQILIRKHNLWHRGTTNYTDKYRLLLSFILIPVTRKHQHVPISNEIEILPNFFKSNFSGRLQEFFYVYFRYFHIFLKFTYSFFSR